MLSIVIPVYNEEKTIKRLIRETLELDIPKEIIVIDDGSTDNSRAILRNEISDPRVKINYNEKNEGKGRALRKGPSLLKGDYVVIQDADLEIPPKELFKLQKLASLDNLDVIYGSRLLNCRNRFHFASYLGNKILTFMTNILFSANLTDMETPLKMFKKDVLRDINLKSRGFEIEAEITAKLLKRNYKITEVPIVYYPRSRKVCKKIGLMDGLIAIFTLLRCRFNLLR